LESVYGLHFASFKSLDEAGPLSVAALKNNEVQVVELFSSDGNVVSNNFVALTDDKHLEGADYIVPVIRKSVDTAAVASALNSLDQKLTTDAIRRGQGLADVGRARVEGPGPPFLPEGTSMPAGKAAGRVPPGTAQYRDGPVPRIPQYRLRWTSRRRR
jgi:osmoprotectant transport system substrate-binding protein